MVRYFYAWTPLVLVGTIVLLALPWLGLIALALVAFVALAALAAVTVWAPLMLGRAISRRWTAAALMPANSSLRPTGATVLLAVTPADRDR